MATISFSRTITTSHQARLIAALRARYAMSPSATGAEIQAEWERRMVADLVGIVRNYEAEVAAASAAAAVAEIAFT